MRMAKEPKKSVTDKAAKPKASQAPKVAAAPGKTTAAKTTAPVKTAASGKAKAAKTAKPAGQSAVKKAAVKKAAAPRKAPAKPVSGSASASGKQADVAAVTPEQRYRMIQDAAYFIAERNGFVGDNHAYWLEAEQAIDAKLAAR